MSHCAKNVVRAVCVAPWPISLAVHSGSWDTGNVPFARLGKRSERPMRQCPCIEPRELPCVDVAASERHWSARRCSPGGVRDVLFPERPPSPPVNVLPVACCPARTRHAVSQRDCFHLEPRAASRGWSWRGFRMAKPCPARPTRGVQGACSPGKFWIQLYIEIIPFSSL